MADTAETPMIERAFQGSGPLLQVVLEPAWLEPGSRLFVGVRTSHSVMETRIGLLRNWNLDPKLGAAFHVEEIFQRKEAGLRWKFLFTAPEGFGNRPDTLLFEIDRSTQQQEWDQMKKTPHLGLYFKPKGLHAPSTPEPGTIAVQRGSQVFLLRFFLLVLPAKA